MASGQPKTETPIGAIATRVSLISQAVLSSTVYEGDDLTNLGNELADIANDLRALDEPVNEEPVGE